MMLKILGQVASLFLLILLLSSAVLTLARLQDPLPPWIAFTSARDGNNEIYRMRFDGSQQERLTHHPANDSQPSWSPDGSWILFTSRRESYNDIYRMRPSGRSQQRLSAPSELLDSNSSKWGAQWSPDGAWILFGGGYGGMDLFRMRPDGSGQERLTENTNENFSGSWSPDSQEIVFISVRNDRLQIYRMNADGGNQTLISQHSSNYGSPTWSPDGAWIVFASDRGGDYDLYKMRPDGSDESRLFSYALSQWDVRWATDNEHIVFSASHSFRRDTADIYRYHVERGELTRLTHTYLDDNFPAVAPIINLPWRGLIMIMLSFLLLRFTSPVRKFILSNIRLLANRP